jgi:hypothetical protein
MAVKPVDFWALGFGEVANRQAKLIRLGRISTLGILTAELENRM